MTDRELLELAAKAAGIEIWGWYEDETGLFYADVGATDVIEWNPLTDDGDALRLAVKLNFDLWNCENYKYISAGVVPADNLFDASLINQKKGKDPYKATRRVIVLAAAEIGRNM